MAGNPQPRGRPDKGKGREKHDNHRPRQKGEGSVIWVDDPEHKKWRAGGRFWARLNLGIVDGKEKILSHYVASYQEGEVWLARQQHDQRAGLRIADANQTLEGYLRDWLETIRSSVKVGSWEHYESKFRLYVFGDQIARVRLTDLNGQHFALLRERLLKRRSRHKRPLAPKTVKHVLVALHVALQAAVDWMLLGRHPMIGVNHPEVPDYDGPILLPEELAALLAASEGDPLEAFWVLLVSAGMRPGEAIGLTKGALNLDVGFAAILMTRRTRGKPVPETPKSKKGVRTLPLPPMAIDALRRHFDRQRFVMDAAGAAWKEEGLVFTDSTGGAVPYYRLNRQWMYLLRRAGLTYREMYCTRRTYATILRNDPRVSDFIVARVMGHVASSTTDAHYAKVLAAPLLQVAAVVEEQLQRVLEEQRRRGPNGQEAGG